MTTELVCLDLAGTTVRDDGEVLVAFAAAISEVGLVPDTPPWREAIDIVTATMGQSKIEVFRRVVDDETAAQRANAAFEASYQDQVAGGGVTAMPGAEDLLKGLRDRDVKVCLTTGFSPKTRDGIIDSLGWADAIDLALSPSDVGRGRPWPDLILSALLKLSVSSVSAVAVVGDTPSDIQSGVRAGAGLIVGVTSGAGHRDELVRAGAHVVVPGVASLHDLLFDSDDPAAASA